MNTLSKFAILHNGSYNVYNKGVARYYLRKFKWTAEQRQILETIVAKGYIVNSYNNVAAVFGKQLATNGDRPTILAVSHGCFGKRKKDLIISAL